MSLRDRLYNVYWKARDIIVPEFEYSQHVYEAVLKQHVQEDTRWLDLGCGHTLLPFWRVQGEEELTTRCRSLTGLDFDMPSLKAHQRIRRKVRGDIGRLPFPDGAFDLVTMNMVVEHLDDPGRQFGEVRRALAPKGLFIFHTPNVLGYGALLSMLVPEVIKGPLVALVEDREEHDIFPTHYRANREKTIRELAKQQGFTVADFRLSVTDAIFKTLPPLFVPELVWIKMLMTGPLRSLRTNIIAILQKTD
jgi:SAM-dependent methyltransferase